MECFPFSNFDKNVGLKRNVFFGHCKPASQFKGLCFMTGVISLWLGCAPSVRYTRGNQEASRANSYYVPADWDYRKSYTIPAERLSATAQRYIGIPYRYGRMSRKGTDCSGLVCMIYYDVGRVKLPHSTRKLRLMGRKIPLQQAKAGDLLFFRRGLFGMVNHVGVYISGKKFIHATTKAGVIYSNLDDTYYKKHFVELRRIFR